jgi:hypothetical protein
MWAAKHCSILFSSVLQQPERFYASKASAEERAMPCHAMPCHAMPCHAMPCHAMPCHAMPCRPCMRLKRGPYISADGQSASNKDMSCLLHVVIFYSFFTNQ